MMMRTSTVTLYIIKYFQNSSISIWRFLVSCEFEKDFPILCAESPPADFSRSLFFQKISKNLFCMQKLLSSQKKLSPSVFLLLFRVSSLALDPSSSSVVE